MSIVGLRKQIDYDTAARLVEVGNPVLGAMAYSATQMVRSPLFQRMAMGIDETATAHTVPFLEVKDPEYRRYFKQKRHRTQVSDPPGIQTYETVE